MFKLAHCLSPLHSTVVQQFQEYVEPEEGEEPKSPRRTTAPGTVGGEDEKVLLPLGETTLTHNLGIPIVVVITKVITYNFLNTFLSLLFI